MSPLELVWGIIGCLILVILIPFIAYILAWVIFYCIIKISFLRRFIFKHINKSLNQTFDNFINQPDKGNYSANQRRITQIIKNFICDYLYFVRTNFYVGKAKMNHVTDSVSESRDKQRLESLIYIILNKRIFDSIPKLFHASDSSTGEKGESTKTELNRKHP
jgi:hypothetical protein